MSLLRNAAARARAVPTRAGAWHPDAGTATIWQTGKKHVTHDGGVLYPKTLYPPRFYKFGFEKITNPDDPYDAGLVTESMDGVTWFKPEYKLFKGQLRRRPNIGYRSGKVGPRFCYKNPMKMFNVWHADYSMVVEHLSTWTRLKYAMSAGGWTFRHLYWMPFYGALAVKLAVKMDKRREPAEIFIDREEYFRSWTTMLYGVYYDHHKYAHMMAIRRANKWHYDNVDLYGAHH